MKTTLRVFCTVAFLFIIPIPNYALEVATHKAINGYIAKGAINGFSLDSYLKNQLGFQNGVEEEFTFGDSKNVWTWIGGGGVTEDKPPGFFQIPYLRSINHFHDPINNQGFSGFIFGLLFHGESSIQWSQKPIGGQSPGGHYSWFDTRDYYYKALTSTIKIDREKYFSETFRGLGQLMHLVQDISVPAHARDQFHMGYDYEKFILRYQPRAEFKSLLANPYQSDKSLLNVVSPLAPIPFANLFDSEKYTGSNPEVTVLGNSIGLSEYTNANFFSDWTIFKNYIHPKKENTNAILIEHEAEDGEIDKPYYISGYQSETLALYSYFANIAPDLPGEWKYTLDDTVHEDYAQKLIPRAVGYSAGLLEYFFRGKIEITEPIIDQGNTRVTLKAKNTTPNNEEMTGGDNASIMLVVKYKVPSGQDYFYIVTPEKNGIKSIPRTEPPTEPPTKPIELTFDLSLSPLPIDATDISFQVVYKGKLGKGEGINWVGEENAVCVGLKMNESPYLIAWYRNNEGAGSVVKNYATDGILGGGLVPNLTVFNPENYWSIPGFAFSEKTGIHPATSYASASFEIRQISHNNCLGMFIKNTQVVDHYDWGTYLSMNKFNYNAYLNLLYVTYDDYWEEGVFEMKTRLQMWNTWASRGFVGNPGEWYFVFYDSDNAMKVVRSDGSLYIDPQFEDPEDANDFYKITLGADSDSPPYYPCLLGAGGCFGDVIIYNNLKLTQEQWGIWYDQLRSRYGMAPRSGW